MYRKFLDCLSPMLGQKPQSITSGATGVTSSYVAVAGYESIIGLGAIATLTNGKIFTVQLMQATSAGGAGAKALGTAATFTAATAVALAGIAVQEARAAQLDAGFTHVAVCISHDEGSGIYGCSALILGAPCEKPASANSSLAQ